MKEQTRIKITYAYNDETGFQAPDLMITKEWFYPDQPHIVTFAECLYVEDDQTSIIYHESEALNRQGRRDTQPLIEGIK